MTERDAYGYLEDMFRLFSQYPFVFTPQVVEADSIAMTALEKQLPQPVWRNDKTGQFLCPACTSILDGPDAYCKKCGQRLSYAGK